LVLAFGLARALACGLATGLALVAVGGADFETIFAPILAFVDFTGALADGLAVDLVEALIGALVDDLAGALA
jgi:hypothetical protein